jgi:hypothetical protein
METTILTEKDFTQTPDGLIYEEDFKCIGHLIIKDNFTANFKKSIKAGWSIEADGSIEAGWSIKADGSIKADWYIKADGSIEADGYIKAGGSIKAEQSIISFRDGIQAQSLYCLRVAVGMKIKDVKLIEATIEKGQVLLGEVAAPNPLQPMKWY